MSVGHWPNPSHAEVPGCRVWVLAGPSGLTGAGRGLMGDDRGHVAVAEAAQHRGVPQRPVHRRGAVQSGQRDGVGHLRAGPGHPGRGGLGQPQRRSRPDSQERLLRRVAGPGGAVQRSFRRRPEMGLDIAGVARGGPLMPVDLDRPGRPDMDDDDLLAVIANPHRLAPKLMRHRVGAVVEGDDWRVRPHDAGHPEGGRVGMGRQAVQRSCSSASISTGTRWVLACTRPLTSRAERLARRFQTRRSSHRRPAGWRRRGTRSAAEIRTVASEPPFDSGSATTQVATVSP